MRNKTGAAYAATKYMEFYVKEPCILMDFLMKEMSGISRNKVKAILAGHGVSVNRKMTTLYNYELKPGMVVRVSRHKRSTELNSKFVKIVYEDKDLIVIEKSIGILSMASAANQFCVKTILDEYFKKRHFKCTAHVVHRLDRDTSGLMMFAKTRAVQEKMQSNWNEMITERTYVAVVEGRPEKDSDLITTQLKENAEARVYVVADGGKDAITRYHLLRTNEKYSLLELNLETGRKNQIRAQMEYIGHPIAGDYKYGAETDPTGRLMLHAQRLYFIHPETGEEMRFDTRIPDSFKSLTSKNW